MDGQNEKKENMPLDLSQYQIRPGAKPRDGFSGERKNLWREIKESRPIEKLFLVLSLVAILVLAVFIIKDSLKKEKIKVEESAPPAEY